MEKLITLSQNPKYAENLLACMKQAGLREAKPAKREGLTPQEISQFFKKLRKNPSNALLDNAPHKKKKNLTKKSGRDNLIKAKQNVLNKKEFTKMAERLAMDFQLANLQAGSYGWADPNAIDVLEIWDEYDENTKFIILYQHPSQLLGFEDGELSDDLLQEKLRPWLSYNKKALQVMKKFPHKTLLVNWEALQSLSVDHLLKVNNQFPMPISSSVLTQNTHYDPLKELVLSHMLSQQYEIMSLYNALQNHAFLPSSMPSIFTAKEAWLKLKNLEERLQEAQLNAKQKEEMVETLLSQTDLMRKEFNKITQENKHLTAENQFLQDENAELKNPPIYGADERVKNWLTYRLGSTLVTKGKTLTGGLLMPIHLYNSYRQYKLAQRFNQGKRKIPLEHYDDIHKVAILKNHLSYKMGEVLLRDLKNPCLWALLPFHLYLVKRRFSKKRG